MTLKNKCRHLFIECSYALLFQSNNRLTIVVIKHIFKKCYSFTTYFSHTHLCQFMLANL